MNLPTVQTIRSDDLVEFLQLHNMEVTEAGDSILRVVRETELPVFLNVGNEVLTFEVDLGPVKDLGGGNLFFELLDENTAIQPVCFAIDNSHPDDPRLILTESRITGDLSDREILSVFDALELAADKAETILQKYLK
jgi:hypothetical protein